MCTHACIHACEAHCQAPNPSSEHLREIVELVADLGVDVQVKIVPDIVAGRPSGVGPKPASGFQLGQRPLPAGGAQPRSPAERGWHTAGREPAEIDPEGPSDPTLAPQPVTEVDRPAAFTLTAAGW